MKKFFITLLSLGLLLGLGGSSLAADTGQEVTVMVEGGSEIIDVTSPKTYAAISGVKGNPGWYTSNVVISLIAKDDYSGVATTEYSVDKLNWYTYTTPVAFDKEGQGAIYFRSIDNAGNTEEIKYEPVQIDKTAPVLEGMVTWPPNENGWYNTAVYVGFYPKDNIGIAYVTPKLTITTEGEGMSVLGEAVDYAGNKTTVTVKGINIDKTAPKIVGEVTTLPNEYGWYNTDVKVAFSSADYLSGLAKATTTEVISTDGIGQSVIGYAYDKAGNASKYIVGKINIDKLAPKILSNLQDGTALERLGTFTLENTSYDNLSGIINLTTYLDGNRIENVGAIDLEKLSFGKHLMLIKTKDMAGNITSTEVRFAITATVDTLKKLLDRNYSEGLIKKSVYSKLANYLNQSDLTGFINEVAKHRDKQIDSITADKLIEYAKWIISVNN